MDELPIATEITDCHIIIVDRVAEPVIDAVVEPIIESVGRVEQRPQYTHTREIISFIICAAIILIFFILIMLAFTN
jgi:hypothetical protein